MARFSLSCSAATALVAVALAHTAPAQSFVDNTTQIPSGAPDNASGTENVDFADVDLDGDWDAVFADGGNTGLDQNRVWINFGGLQGGAEGNFVDETATRFPVENDASRDIEFADIDGDGDPDVFVSDTSSIVNEASLWWVNLGGDQGGSLGFFQDETAARWVGLGGPGSSIPASAVLPGGGFVNWVGDSDFGDVDDDGDLDLVHSSYGGAFGGGVPTRIFLNDGDGFFSEFNPSGFQLPFISIQNGEPGLWCEGSQQHGTTDTTGRFCDIATAAVDVDLGDVDGDFDLDILLGDRQGEPRLFANRSDGSNLAPALFGGGFRDVTGFFPPGYATGTGAFEQELGDFDADGDLDILGINWGGGAFAFNEHLLVNMGDGTFDPPITLADSQADDEEGDFFDYDNDGDLDLIIANFSGQDRLYANIAGLYVNVTASEMPAYDLAAHDADAADVDGDGDYDVFVANDANQRNVFLENASNIRDTHAPLLPNLEQAPDRNASPEPTVVRVHVYDNAPYYVTYFNGTWLEYSVDGGAPTIVPMASSGGQVFRAEIPGAIVGTVDYQAFSRDDAGNTGASVSKTFVAGTCNVANFCSSTPNSTGGAAVMSPNVSCTVVNNALVLSTSPVPNQNGLFYYASTQAGGGAGVPFGNGLRCVGDVGSPLQRLPVEMAVGNVLTHHVDMTSPPNPSGQITVGSTWYFQAWFRDPAAAGAFFDLSDGLWITFR